MKQWLKRTRGAIGIGLTSAAGWAPLGASSAAGTLVIAKASHSQPLLQGEDVADAALTAESLRLLRAKVK